MIYIFEDLSELSITCRPLRDRPQLSHPRESQCCHDVLPGDMILICKNRSLGVVISVSKFNVQIAWTWRWMHNDRVEFLTCSYAQSSLMPASVST